MRVTFTPELTLIEHRTPETFRPLERVSRKRGSADEAGARKPDTPPGISMLAGNASTVKCIYPTYED